MLVNFRIEDTYVEVEANVDTVDRTGVEMEALTAAAVAALTIYDMCKSIDRSMTIGDLQLWEKTGGRSGTWRRQSDGTDRVWAVVSRSGTSCWTRFDMTARVLARLTALNDPPLGNDAVVSVFENKGGREALTLVVLVILAALWAVVLLPPLLRSPNRAFQRLDR